MQNPGDGKRLDQKCRDGILSTNNPIRHLFFAFHRLLIAGILPFSYAGIIVKPE
jgi:hypothetical protein